MRIRFIILVSLLLYSFNFYSLNESKINTFLNDSNVYDCKILNIKRIKKAYLIYVEYNKNDKIVKDLLLSPKLKGSKTIRIKRGNTYKMRLIPYYNTNFFFSEYKLSHCIILGFANINFKTSGKITNLYLTQNLNGLYYIPIDAKSQNKFISYSSNELESFVLDFVKSIYIKNDSILLNQIDSKIFIKSLINSKIYKKFFNINITNIPGFFNMFYPTPEHISIETINISINNSLKQELLITYNDVNIVKVSWRIPMQDKILSALIAIKKYEPNLYKVISCDVFN